MTTSKLNIGTYQLPAAEAVLIRTIVRLSSHNANFNWAFTDAQHCDAVIIDGTAIDHSDPADVASARAVLTIVRAGEDDAPNTLARPIRAEKLQAWLQETAARLMAGTITAARLPGHLQATSARLHTRFKLRRWPPSTLVRNDPALIRMSTLLSRRSLLLTELAELSQQSLDACHLFIQSLLPVGLLDLEPLPSHARSAAAMAPAAQRMVPAGAPKASFGRGLISGIRRRLGL